ncbi:MAG: hypothetical protein AB1449_12020 [Chloroflexota bacterium]
MTWVHDGIYAGGGDHIPVAWGSFADQTGIQAVVHLRRGAPAEFGGPPPAAFLWLNLDGEEEAGVEERWLAGNFVAEQLAAGRKVLLHSSRARHRTRWVYVAYQVCVGRQLRAALRQAAQRPWLSPYYTDRAVWEDFSRAVASRRG